MRKKIVVLIIILFLITGCTKKENSNVLNVLNWSSYIPDSVLDEFESETGIKLNYGTYSSNEELLAKVTASKTGTYDLVFPSDYMVELMIEKNLLMKLDKTEISNLSNINTNYLNLYFDENNDYSLPFIAATMVIAYNTENIKESINSYNDLLNSKYKNDIVVVDDQRIMIGMALLALGYDMNDTDESHLEQAKDWLLKFKKNIKSFDSDSPKTLLMTNEVDIGFIWNAEAAIAMEENPNIKVVYPDDGFAISLDNYCILNGAKHISNAYKFINFLLRPDIMAQIINDYPYKNINIEAEALLSSDYLDNTAANTPDYELVNSYFVKNIGNSISEYDKIWAEIK